MHSSTIVLAIGLLASPLALLGNSASQPMVQSLTQLAQYSTGAPEQSIHGRPLADAPVPDAIPGLSPANRVATHESRSLDAGPVNATPFSAGPISNYAAGSPATPNGISGDVATPGLGK